MSSPHDTSFVLSCPARALYPFALGFSPLPAREGVGGELPGSLPPQPAPPQGLSVRGITGVDSAVDFP
jgi:hypothetical protein